MEKRTNKSNVANLIRATTTVLALSLTSPSLAGSIGSFHTQPRKHIMQVKTEKKIYTKPTAVYNQQLASDSTVMSMVLKDTISYKNDDTSAVLYIISGETDVGIIYNLSLTVLYGKDVIKGKIVPTYEYHLQSNTVFPGVVPPFPPVLTNSIPIIQKIDPQARLILKLRIESDRVTGSVSDGAGFSQQTEALEADGGKEFLSPKPGFLMNTESIYRVVIIPEDRTKTAPHAVKISATPEPD